MRVIKADVELGRGCQASWSAQFQLAARELMGGEFTLSPDMVLGTKAMEVKWLESMMRTGIIPAAWKVARISPLFKDTDPTDPNKYRMLAVSSVLYRLYANVLRHVLTAWCITHKVLPAEQFGFIPGRSTMQPMFILRHLVHAQKASADAKHRKLFTAFIDFKQAYDHIPRQQLWEHLRVGIKLPQPLLACLEGLYRDDNYVLIDGPHRTPPVTPDQGVKQGCPISPLLFALYVHDISKEFLGPVDAVRVQGTPVTHFMYADDLTLVSTSPHGLQRLVCQLQGFADRKHLTVNVGKSKVMVFNGNSQTAAPCIGYKHENLPVVREFKYLGMHFNPSATPAFAATHMRAGMFLAMRQACNRAREYGVLHDPFALCHLIRAFVLPLGLYGSQVWGTAFLGHGVQLSNPVQTRMLSFLRFAARVRSSVSGLMVLHELGQLPLQLYWFRAACKFWNTAKLSHSDLLMRVIKADVELGRSCQASWSAQFQLAARELMGDEFTLSPDMVLGTKAMEVKWLERRAQRSNTVAAASPDPWGFYSNSPSSRPGPSSYAASSQASDSWARSQPSPAPRPSSAPPSSSATAATSTTAGPAAYNASEPWRPSASAFGSPPTSPSTEALIAELTAEEQRTVRLFQDNARSVVNVSTTRSFSPMFSPFMMQQQVRGPSLVLLAAALKRGLSTRHTLLRYSQHIAPAGQLAKRHVCWLVWLQMPRGVGSGFVWDYDGHIITNAHVIAGAQEVTVTLCDGTVAKAKVVGGDREKDIAVLKVVELSQEQLASLRPVKLGSSSNLLVGQRVYAVGNPFGLDLALSQGIVSGLGREISAGGMRGGLGAATITNGIQTDTAMNPGNSGGPLLDSAGRVVGIATAILDPTGRGVSSGVGFAIPIDAVRGMVDQILRLGRVVRPALGITIAPVPQMMTRQPRWGMQAEQAPKAEGVLVVSVQPGGPADLAGVQPTRRELSGRLLLGDIITGINGRTVRTQKDLFAALDNSQVGDTAEVVVRSASGSTRTVRLTLADREKMTGSERAQRSNTVAAASPDPWGFYSNRPSSRPGPSSYAASSQASDSWAQSQPSPAPRPSSAPPSSSATAATSTTAGPAAYNASEPWRPSAFGSPPTSPSTEALIAELTAEEQRTVRLFQDNARSVVNVSTTRSFSPMFSPFMMQQQVRGPSLVLLAAELKRGLSTRHTLLRYSQHIAPARQLAKRHVCWLVWLQMPRGVGSGFVWDYDGHIITNAHVIAGAQEVTVTLCDGTVAKAKVVGGDREKDIAVLKVVELSQEQLASLRPVKLGSSSNLLVGQRVYAVGNPFGLDLALSQGIVSGLGREISAGGMWGGLGAATITNGIQTDTAMNPGNSGGPLLDSAGRVVGIATAILDPTGRGVSSGVGFAIPIDAVRGMVDQILRLGRVVRPALGITIAPVPQMMTRQPRWGMQAEQAPKAEGVLVVSVQPGGPADLAGVQPTRRELSGRLLLGDIITGINGRTVRTQKDLFAALDNSQVGDTAEVVVRSASGSTRTVRLTLADREKMTGSERAQRSNTVAAASPDPWGFYSNRPSSRPGPSSYAASSQASDSWAQSQPSPAPRPSSAPPSSSATAATSTTAGPAAYNASEPWRPSASAFGSPPTSPSTEALIAELTAEEQRTVRLFQDNARSVVNVSTTRSFSPMFSPFMMQQQVRGPSLVLLAAELKRGLSTRHTLLRYSQHIAPAGQLAKRHVCWLVWLQMPRGVGSGFVWDYDGHIITNAHVIAGAQEVTVTLCDGTVAKAKVVGGDREKDIAVLKVVELSQEQLASLRPVKLGSSSNLLVGQRVYAVGNPFGLDLALSQGIVSGLGREISAGGMWGGLGAATITNGIQTDTAMNPGNSGGPLLDSAGRVVGIATAILDPTGRGVSSGVGFAIPIDAVRGMVDQILRLGRVVRPALGITIAPVPQMMTRQPRWGMQAEQAPKAEGVLVVSVQPGGPADLAGVQPTRRELSGRLLLGDIITGINGRTVRTQKDLFAALDNSQVGDTAEVVVRSASGSTRTVRLTLADREKMTGSERAQRSNTVAAASPDPWGFYSNRPSSRPGPSSYAASSQASDSWAQSQPSPAPRPSSAPPSSSATAATSTTAGPAAYNASEPWRPSASAFGSPPTSPSTEALIAELTAEEQRTVRLFQDNARSVVNVSTTRSFSPMFSPFMMQQQVRGPSLVLLAAELKRGLSTRHTLLRYSQHIAPAGQLAKRHVCWLVWLQMPRGVGSGFVWDYDGHIITNAHVIAGAQEVTVTLCDGTVAKAKVVGGDREKDIAVLKVVELSQEQLASLRPVKLGSSSNLLVGQRVYAVGNPFGLDLALSQGIVSGLGREISAGGMWGGLGAATITNGIQTDTAMNPGNSGGPLLDSAGRVVGIATAILDPTGRGVSSGVGFAIPIDAVRGMVDQILRLGRVVRPALGITIAPVPQMMTRQPRWGMQAEQAPKAEGVLVVSVQPGGPADLAGVQPTRRELSGRLLLGDIITGINGRTVRTQKDLFAALDNSQVGDTAEVVVRSASGSTRTVRLTLADREKMTGSERAQRSNTVAAASPDPWGFYSNSPSSRPGPSSYAASSQASDSWARSQPSPAPRPSSAPPSSSATAATSTTAGPAAYNASEPWRPSASAFGSPPTSPSTEALIAELTAEEQRTVRLFQDNARSVVNVSTTRSFSPMFSPFMMQQQVRGPSLVLLAAELKRGLSTRHTLLRYSQHIAPAGQLAKRHVCWLVWLQMPRGVGSGFVWDYDGHIITNAHVIAGAQEVTVTLCDGTVAKAKVVGGDREKDIAVLKVVELSQEQLASLRPVKLGSSSNLLVGQRVYAVGNPFGLDLALSQGIVSGLGREISAGGMWGGLGAATITNGIQTDTAMNPGNSGGPLLDSAGRVVGIATAILDPTGRGVSSGVGFAIPIDAVRGMVDQILRLGRVVRPALGITIAPVPQMMTRQPRWGMQAEQAPKAEGVLVVSVQPGGPADLAGVQPTRRELSGRLLLGDIITGINGRTVRTQKDLFAALDNSQVGDTAEVVVRSASGSTRTVRLTLADREKMTGSE
ncbi:hypothetical protein QJQ45_003709 [Haematococcus lacustris]|nr:hypothetical protein QJQ45_003709 [Haematococcus lacustris]